MSITKNRAPKVDDQVVYISRTLGAKYDARITKVHEPGRADSPVDLIAYKPNEKDEIWRDNITQGDGKGQWNWPPPPEPEAAKK